MWFWSIKILYKQLHLIIKRKSAKNVFVALLKEAKIYLYTFVDGTNLIQILIRILIQDFFKNPERHQGSFDHELETFVGEYNSQFCNKIPCSCSWTSMKKFRNTREASSSFHKEPKLLNVIFFSLNKEAIFLDPVTENQE